MNHDLERELATALRRHEPPDDFAARVMARIAEESPAVPVEARSETITWWQRFTAFWQMPSSLQWGPWATAGALACLLVMFGTYRYREHQRLEAERIAFEQAEGERAKEQVILALQIASAKLNVAQRKVRESSERAVELR
jgi:negative regulator of sigma E activity